MVHFKQTLLENISSAPVGSDLQGLTQFIAFFISQNSGEPCEKNWTLAQKNISKWMQSSFQKQEEKFYLEDRVHKLLNTLAYEKYLTRMQAGKHPDPYADWIEAQNELAQRILSVAYPSGTVVHFKKPLDYYVRWMIRRDMPEVLDIEQQCFEFPWDEEDFIRCLRQRNCIGMVSQDEEKVKGFMIYELHKTR